MSAALEKAIEAYRAGQADEAEAIAREILAASPANTDAHNLLCIILLRTARFEEALAAADAALAATKAPVLHFHRATALFALSRQAEALISYDAGLAHDGNIAMQAARFFTGLYLCDWHQYEARVQALIAAIDQNRFSPNPFQLLFLPSTLRQQRLAAERLGAQMPNVPPMFRNRRVPGRLRIAYVSGDFRAHPVTWLIIETLRRHDREKFEIFVVSHGEDDGSNARKNLAAAPEHFIDCAGLDDAAIAARIAALGSDIAIDLDGHTADARPGIFSHRPAPLQVNYLGFPGTMGSRHYDYIIADSVITPPAHQPYYSEQLVRLPFCYLPATQRPAPATLTRADCGLPEKGFVFCAFTAPYKISPQVFDVWLRLLEREPDSVLWLRGGDAALEENLRDYAFRGGIRPHRLIFAPHANSETYFARLALADLYLDTFVYGAHTTAGDALWSGVPVVTLEGETFARRVAASLLTDTGLPQLIAHSIEEYENIAAHMAADPETLALFRNHVRLRRDGMHDATRFARHLESAFTAMWARHESGKPPLGFPVKL